MQGSAKGQGVISTAEYMRWRGVCWRPAQKQLAGLDYLPGRQKKYLIDDVVDRLMEERRA